MVASPSRSTDAGEGQPDCDGAAGLQPGTALNAYIAAKKLIDAARLRPATQSSLSQWSTLDDASGAVSGQFPADFAFHTGEEASPWWQVDLGSVYPIELIVVHNRRLDAQYRAQTLEVLVSLDGEDWATIHRNSLPFAAALDGLPLMLMLRGKTEARFIRLQLAETTYLHLSQVQVFVSSADARLNDFVRQAVPTAAPDRVEPVALGILGTSNSIIVDGYTAALQADPDIRLLGNFSLGASHPTVVPYCWTDEVFRACDCVVFDLNVNEQFGIENLSYDPAMTEQLLRSILLRCGELDLVPLILILPETMSYNPAAGRPFASRRNWLDLCRRYGVPFLDGYRMLDEIAASTGADPRSLFKDQFHVDVRMSSFIATCLSAAATTLLPGLRRELRTANVSRWSYIPGSAALAHANGTVERQSSIVTETFIVLRPGQPVDIPLPPGTVIIGLVFNLRGSNAALRISGLTITTKNLCTPVFNAEQSLWVISCALLSPVTAGEQGIRLECVLHDDASVLEANDQGNAPPCREHAMAVVELAGLIATSPFERVSIAAYSGGDLDLWRAVKARFPALAPPAPPPTHGAG